MSPNLRDYFAAKAVQGLLTGHASVSEEDAKRIADQAYRVADAMVEQHHGLPKRFKCTTCRDGQRPYMADGERIPCGKCGQEPAQ